MIAMKECVLYDRECIECGECNRCDLDPNKICDNCMKCIDQGQDYKEIIVEDIVDGDENAAPVEPAIDKKELARQWALLRQSGLWKAEYDEGEDD